MAALSGGALAVRVTSLVPFLQLLVLYSPPARCSYLESLVLPFPFCHVPFTAVLHGTYTVAMLQPLTFH